MTTTLRTTDIVYVKFSMKQKWTFASVFFSLRHIGHLSRNIALNLAVTMFTNLLFQTLRSP